MAEGKRLIKYGDKQFELDAGMTLDQAKQIMARHFPELADPEVKTEKSGDETTYVFSKKAGRKGKGASVASVSMTHTADRLARLKPADVIPAPVLAVATVLLDGELDGEAGDGADLAIDNVDGLARQMRDDAREVDRIGAALVELAPAVVFDGSLLL